MGHLLSSKAQVARHGHHRICSPDRPRVDMWRRTTGGLLEVRRCAVVGAPLAIWRYSLSRADLGLTPRAAALGTRVKTLISSRPMGLVVLWKARP